MRRLAILLAFCPGAALGQEMVFDPGPTEACLAAGTADPAACAGHAADACMVENEMGETTVGMGFCLSQEWEWWDARLNAAYGALRAMQRAWIAYRDAACDYERAQWSGGTGGGPATAACLMRETAEQALVLEAKLAQGWAQ